MSPGGVVTILTTETIYTPIARQLCTAFQWPLYSTVAPRDGTAVVRHADAGDAASGRVFASGYEGLGAWNSASYPLKYWWLVLLPKQIGWTTDQDRSIVSGITARTCRLSHPEVLQGVRTRGSATRRANRRTRTLTVVTETRSVRGRPRGPARARHAVRTTAAEASDSTKSSEPGARARAGRPGRTSARGRAVRAS